MWAVTPKLWFVVAGKILVEKSVTGRSGGAPLAWIRQGVCVFWLLCVPGRVSQRCARFWGGGAAVWGGVCGHPLQPKKNVGFWQKNGSFFLQKKVFFFKGCFHKNKGENDQIWDG